VVDLVEVDSLVVVAAASPLPGADLVAAWVAAAAAAAVAVAVTEEVVTDESAAILGARHQSAPPEIEPRDQSDSGESIAGFQSVDEFGHLDPD